MPLADLSREGLPSFDEIGFDDALSVGVRAANLAELYAAVPEHAALGFAVPFSAYDRYMRDNHIRSAQCVAAQADCESEGRAHDVCTGAASLCADGATADDDFYGYVDRVLRWPDLETDSVGAEARFDGLAHLLRHGVVATDFAAALNARVTELFGTRQVRLRSSTNAEDLPGFSGAGLYDSVSAQGSGDDLASDEIRKVWSSVWTWRAFAERAFWNVEQRAVRMGVAVSPAYDDELVNGVVITRDLAMSGGHGFYVNLQQGEVPVTNPDNGALPEVFTIVPAPGGGVQATHQRYSSLTPDTPLIDAAEILALHDAVQRVLVHFAPLYQQSPARLALDLEVKWVAPDRRLVIKQARPYAAQ